MESRPPEWPVIAASDVLYERARPLIPAATQTLAKGPGQHVRGVAPKFARKGRGCRLTDVDGNEFIDFSMGIGPLVLGYCHPRVDEAIAAQLADGITFSLPHRLEVEVAEQIAALVPGAEMVRFSKTGCDVTTAAVRVARAYTGRDKVLCCGYHGWHDWYIGTTSRGRGVPDAVAALTRSVPYNDLTAVEQQLDDETACLILEPTTFEAPKPGYLEGLAAICKRRGALLVFDEMWTGFRCALGGAQARYGVQADLATFSKAVANGMPLSVLTGRAEVMQLLDKDVFFFTTFGGEALSLAAAMATLEVLESEKVPEVLEKRGEALKSEYAKLAVSLELDFTRCVGLGCRSMVTFEQRGIAALADPLLMKSLVQQELLRRGILWSGFHNLAFAHGDKEIATLLAAYREALVVLRDALGKKDLRGALRGEPVEAVFRRVDTAKPEARK